MIAMNRMTSTDAKTTKSDLASKKIARAVIFDMDGLMLDTEPIHRQAWQRAARACGYRLTDAHYLECVGRTDEDGALILLRMFGAAFPMPQFRSCRKGSWEEHVTVHGIPLKPGLLELLDFLEAYDLKKAVATSTYRLEALRLLEGLDLADRFDSLVGGDEVARGKPAPDIFLAAAAKLGVTPDECLVLEDSEAGIEAARAAGMRAIMVPDLKQPSPTHAAMADWVVTSLHEARQLFEEGRLWPCRATRTRTEGRDAT